MMTTGPSFPKSNAITLLAVAVGNTRTRLARMQGLSPHGAISIANDQSAELARAIDSLMADEHTAPAFVSSVNLIAATKVEDVLAERLGADRVFRFGRDAAIPMSTSLDDDTTVGHDRLLSCLGAYATTGDATIVIDAGTCVTIDFIDGTGVFHGGAIAPGLAMMLNAMHQGTAALPHVEVKLPDPARGSFGRDTAHAMQLGVFGMVRGAARYLAELYADAYAAYPRIAATGGDAEALFTNDDLVERIDPNLQLVGIAHAAALNVQREEAGDSSDDDNDDGEANPMRLGRANRLLGTEIDDADGDADPESKPDPDDDL